MPSGSMGRTGGAHQESTTHDKLHRAEMIYWDPPNVCFTLERHGGTVNGSTRAFLHHWQVNVEAKQASIVSIGSRQLKQMAKAMDVKQLAMETSQRILSGEDHESLA